MRPCREGFSAALLSAVAVVGIAGCKADLFGPPARVKTHGYRAMMSIRDGDRVTKQLEIAERGSNLRVAPLSPKEGPELLLQGDPRRAFRLNPGAHTFSEIPWAKAVEELPPGHPLIPGFDERAEAERRGIQHYRRDSDEVLSGHVCALWRFEDRPGEDDSPTTTYWVAADLDGLVVRVERRAPRPEGGRSELVTELTNVRLGADPSAFEVPRGFAPDPVSPRP